MAKIIKRTLADDVRAARETPTRETFQQGGFLGVAGKVAANVALMPSDYIEFIKTAPKAAVLGATVLANPNTELGRQAYGAAIQVAQKASETSIPERIKYMAENPPDVTNAVTQMVGPAGAWKGARRLSYELLPTQTVLYLRSLAQRKSLQTTLPKRANAAFYSGIEQALDAREYRNIHTITELRQRGNPADTSRLNPEVVDSVKETLKQRLGREVDEREILVFASLDHPPSAPRTQKLLEKAAYRFVKKDMGTIPVGLTEDSMFHSLNKFYVVQEGDTYHVVDLYKFFPLYEGHEEILGSTKELFQKLVRGQLEDAPGGVLAVPQNLATKHGSAYPVYWKVTKPE